MMDSEGHTRHFPPPWTVDDQGSCFVVRDHNGQALAYVYYDHPQAWPALIESAVIAGSTVQANPSMLQLDAYWPPHAAARAT
jgi:hypothetical protein